MPATQLGRPRVLAGEVSLGRRVRWLHVSELKDIAEVHGGALDDRHRVAERLLRVGRLCVTTGFGGGQWGDPGNWANDTHPLPLPW